MRYLITGRLSFTTFDRRSTLVVFPDNPPSRMFLVDNEKPTKVVGPDEGLLFMKEAAGHHVYRAAGIFEIEGIRSYSRRSWRISLRGAGVDALEIGVSFGDEPQMYYGTIEACLKLAFNDLKVLLS